MTAVGRTVRMLTGQEMGINKSEQKNNPKVFLVTYLFHCLSVCNGYLRNTKTLNHETLHA